MSAGDILISTHDLGLAGALREGFKGTGYGTELVTPTEELTAEDAALLILTGGMEAGGGALALQARDRLGVPVFAIASAQELAPAQRPGFEEVFARATPVEDIVVVARHTVERRRLRRVTGIIGETDAMKQVIERVVQIAPVASTVLVTGESGTGKEWVARGIHALSPRRHKPFIAVNVAALSDTLLESELFGHEKGAFTGAIDARKGLFELADGGTIFLDEIGEMPLATQTKLLRVLEQREFHRVGAERTIKVDVRIVAATNQDLRQRVAMGEFRRDLYFRLNVLSIELPPLRARRDDIPLLVQAFVEEVSAANDREFPGISAEAMQLLMEYSWPGNIRELRNLVESMVVLAPGRVIRPEDIPEDVRAGTGSRLLPVALPRASDGDDGGGGTLRPELEFIFRTLVELRVDMDDLRRDFEVYRAGEAPALPRGAIFGRVGGGVSDALAEGEIRIGPPEEPAAGGRAPVDTMGWGVDPAARSEGGFGHPPVERSASDAGPAAQPHQSAPPEDGVVVFRPGMTMDELEERAIAAALEEVNGNRRKAAELLGIGERTLYRKIAKYQLDA